MITRKIHSNNTFFQKLRVKNIVMLHSDFQVIILRAIILRFVFILPPKTSFRALGTGTTKHA